MVTHSHLLVLDFKSSTCIFKPASTQCLHTRENGDFLETGHRGTHGPHFCHHLCGQNPNSIFINTARCCFHFLQSLLGGRFLCCLPGLWMVPREVVEKRLEWNILCLIEPEAWEEWSKGTSLTVQWLRSCFHCRGAQVPSLVGQLGSHMPWDVTRKKKRIVENSVGLWSLFTQWWALPLTHRRKTVVY